MVTPTFLVEKLKESRFDIRRLTGNALYASRPILSDYADDTSNPIPLLYQSGYLTIKGYERRRRYLLGFPNKEVEDGFLNNQDRKEVQPEDEPGNGGDHPRGKRHLEN